MKNLFITILFLCPAFIFSQNYNGPESVEGDTLTGNYYVSNPPSGAILRRLPDGTLENFVTGASSPHGLEIVGDVIYACEGGTVVGYSLTDGSEVSSVQTGGGFLNGITHDDNGFLYVTDFSGKRIYKIDIMAETSETFVANTVSTPNGIVYDFINDRLVFVSWGGGADIVEVNLADGSLNVLSSTTLSNIDGVAMDGDGNFYVASWGADAAHRFESTFTDPPELVVTGLDRPADIYYNLKTDTLAIPNAGDNTVSFTFFGEDPPSASNERLIDFHLSLYPNPASNILKVRTEVENLFESVDFEIINSSGQLMPINLMYGNANQLQFDLKNLPSGNYFLKLKRGNDISVKSFVKK